MEDFAGCAIVVSFARSIIQRGLDGGHRAVAGRREVSAFRRVLPNQTVGVFVGAAFPSGVGMREVDVDAGRGA